LNALAMPPEDEPVPRAKALKAAARQPRSPLPTPRQQQVLDFVRAHLDEFHSPPTVREIGRALGGVSTNAVDDLLLALECKGFIERRGGRARGIVLRSAGLDAAPTESERLSELLLRVLDAAQRLPALTGEMTELLAAIREELGGREGGSGR
jgi:SOS-response transcriptional repressor LexA